MKQKTNKQNIYSTTRTHKVYQILIIRLKPKNAIGMKMAE